MPGAQYEIVLPVLSYEGLNLSEKPRWGERVLPNSQPIRRRIMKHTMTLTFSVLVAAWLFALGFMPSVPAGLCRPTRYGPPIR